MPDDPTDNAGSPLDAPAPIVTMCGKQWPLVPQRTARLTAGIGDVIALCAAEGSALTAQTFIGFARGRLYDVLVALIPDMELIPAWQFHGYVGDDDYQADVREGTRNRYRALADRTSATNPEILDAIRAAIKVNRLDELVELVIDPKVLRMLKAEVNAALAEAISTSFSNLPSASGVSGSTSSTTLAAIDAEKKASHGRGSSD